MENIFINDSSYGTRHYISLTDKIYRFTPFMMDMKETKMIHGVNERLEIKQYEKAINFFKHLIRNSDQNYSKKDKKHIHMLMNYEKVYTFLTLYNSKILISPASY